MADRRGLGLMGFFFGGVTLAVGIIAFTLVLGHVQGQRAFDETAVKPQLVSLSGH